MHKLPPFLGSYCICIIINLCTCVTSLLHHQDLLEVIFVSPEDYGDLYLDIVDAYMENSECR